MSFYIVPSVSFQTQQKLKNSGIDKSDKHHKHKKRSKKPHDKSKQGGSGTNSKVPSSPTSSTNVSVGTPSIYEEPTDPKSPDPTVPTISQPVNPTELSNNLEKLKRSESSSSLSSNIATKYITGVNSESNNELKSGVQTPKKHTRPTEPSEGGISPFLPHLDIRRSSTSTTSSVPRPNRYRRNSSLSSSHTASSSSMFKDKSLKQPGNISSSLSPAQPSTPPSQHSTSSNQPQTPSPPINIVYDSAGESDASSRIFKPSYSMAQVDDFPEFSTIKDLRFLESPGKMQENLYSPSFQVFRFSNFLDILNAQHNNDPINFANIRHNGISKFILRHSEYSNKSIDDDWKPHDMRDFEAPLAYSLIKMRSFLRILIRSQSGKDGKGAELFSCEELVQLNFTNYLRFLLNLPQKFTSTPTNQLDETSAMHQSFKIMFTRIIKALLTFRKEETGDVMSNTTTATSLLLQLITKVSYEFILLEKYHINIITKLGNNSLLDSRVVERLFRQYHKGLSQPPSRRNLPKVLVYNSYFSAQYSWYMCVTIPFLTVVEMAVFNEDQELISDPERYRQQEKNTVKTSFEKSDAMLYASYFKDIKFKNYQKFRSTSDEQFVSIQRANHDNSSVSESLISSSQHKPKNFNFNCESLATIPNATFDVVQSRDLLFQLTNSNYRTIISELHRVLKIGGTLEVPIILSGTDTISPDTTTVGFPKFTNATGLNLSKYYDMIPDFAEVLLKIILEVFGEGNVRMATALLNTTSEMSDFLVKDIGLHIAEMVGETDKYCRASQHPIGERNKDVHFFFQIQAEKTFN